MVDKNTVLEYALWYVSQGIFVNPVRRNSKALLRSGPVMRSATRDPETVRGLFADDAGLNLGVVPGADSDLVVLDVDNKNGAEGYKILDLLQSRCGPLPRTLQETTPSGGGHLFFRRGPHAIGNGKLTLDGHSGLDVFGSPHNVVVAPSTISDGRYEQLERVELAPLPKAWAEYFLTQLPARKNSDRVQIGGRNDALFRDACRLRRLGIGEPEALSRVREINQVKCDPPLPDHEVVKLVRSACSRDAGYERSDLGNTQRFFDHRGLDFKYVAELNRWLHFNGLRFVEDFEDLVTRLMKGEMRRALVEATQIFGPDHPAIRWYIQSENEPRIRAAINLLRSEDGITIRQKQLDRDRRLLGTKNAIMDLRTGLPVAPNRDDLITRSCGAEYDASATCPVWIGTLERLLPDPEVRGFFQRYVGYALTGETNEQCLTILWGAGANGKTTILETLLALLGDYGGKAPASAWLLKRDTIPSDLASLVGKRLVVSSELEANARLASSLIKAVAGQETLAVRHLYGSWFEFRPEFKIMLATNHPPAIDGSDGAMARRLRLIPFKVQIPPAEQDRDLADKLLAELPGILNWAIEGFTAWAKDGLGVPALVREATSDYVQDNNPITAFIAECCMSDTSSHVASGTLYSRYRRWCMDSGTPLMSPQRFKQALLEQGVGYRRTASARVFMGLRLLLEDPAGTGPVQEVTL